MSFSAEVKKEALGAKITKLCCQRAFFLACFAFGGRLSGKGDTRKMCIGTENSNFAKIIAGIVKKLYGIDSEVLEKSKNNNAFFDINICGEENILKILRDLKLAENSSTELINVRISDDIMEKSCCRKAFIKGAFLMCGTIIDPEKRYHLEFVTPHCILSENFFDLLLLENLNAKRIVRKSNYVLYFKQGDDIADILGICGSVSHLMEFHNIRILKDMRNNVNRIVNCENANMDKTLDASIRQSECIKFLENSGNLDSLSPALKEIAYLRLENTDLSLSELGKLVTPQLSRSGVNHRLKKLCDIADKLKAERNE